MADRGLSTSKGGETFKFTVLLGRECRRSEAGTRVCGAPEEESWDVSLRAPVTGRGE